MQSLDRSHFRAVMGLVLARMLSRVPFSVGLWLARPMGWILVRVLRSRREVCARNIEVCFPELSRAQQAQLVDACFVENAFGVFETAWAWYRPPSFLDGRLRFENLELVSNALATGRGVLLIGAHYSCLDLSGVMMYRAVGRYTASFRLHDNAILNEEMVRQRGKYIDLVNVRDTRDIVQRLKSGELLWFGFDQDMGPRGSVFAPFFGQPACTVKTPARLIDVTQSIPIFMRVHRSEGCYIVRFEAFPSWYPSSDHVQNATALNAMLENALRDAPAQYIWMHKRFKTAPGGTRGDFYRRERRADASIARK